MIAIKTKAVGFRQDGKQLIQAFILSDTTSTVLPTTGESVTGMSAKDVFAPGSVLYVLDDVTIKTYIANESGVFVGQKQQSGGNVVDASLDYVTVLAANFSDSTSYTILNGKYYENINAIVG